MKLLVLSCDTGEGHNSCAKAIREEFLIADANIPDNHFWAEERCKI